MPRCRLQRHPPIFGFDQREVLLAFIAAGQIGQNAVDPRTVEPPHHFDREPAQFVRFIEQRRGNQHALGAPGIKSQRQLARRCAAGQRAGIAGQLHASACLARVYASKLP